MRVVALHYIEFNNMCIKLSVKLELFLLVVSRYYCLLCNMYCICYNMSYNIIFIKINTISININQNKSNMSFAIKLGNPEYIRMRY